MKHVSVLILTMWCAANVFAQTESSKNSPNRAPETAVYIPADKRHQGLSRYDLIPFTDRRKGDPDRYRAVNPNFVKRENGRFFYKLTVKSGTPLFDENLKAKGALTKREAEIDLTDTKTSRSANGENIRYVFVKNKGYAAASAIAETPEEIKNGRWFQFPLKRGEHLLYDGTGIARGSLAAPSVKLNYGLQKEIGGEKYYYAFSTKIKIKDATIGASGWIKASAIEKGNDPRFDPQFVSRMQVPTGAGDRFTRYEITGGEPEEKIVSGEGGAPRYRFGYADQSGNFVAYNVLPKIPLDGRQSVAITDYLKRGDGVINLGFNPAGVSNDTFRVEGANRPLIFYRSSEPDAAVEIDHYYPQDGTHDGTEIAAQALFVYGYVAVPNGKRWGWIPFEALQLAPE
jgi:hypothetical protein